MELGSASHIAAEAQRELISRTGEHARDMRERINDQAWAEPNQMVVTPMGVFGGPAAGGALAAARSNRPSSATSSPGGRREERVRPSSATNSSAGGAAALARQRRRADQPRELTVVDSVDKFDELMHSVDDLLSPEPPSHPSPPPRGRPTCTSSHSHSERWPTSASSHSHSGSRAGPDRTSLGGPISFKPRISSATGEPLSARARRLEESLESANGMADVRTALHAPASPSHPALRRHRTPRAAVPPHATRRTATARHAPHCHRTPRAAPISPQSVEGEVHRLSLLALHLIVS